MVRLLRILGLCAVLSFGRCQLVVAEGNMTITNHNGYEGYVAEVRLHPCSCVMFWLNATDGAVPGADGADELGASSRTACICGSCGDMHLY